MTGLKVKLKLQKKGEQIILHSTNVAVTYFVTALFCNSTETVSSNGIDMKQQYIRCAIDINLQTMKMSYNNT